MNIVKSLLLIACVSFFLLPGCAKQQRNETVDKISVAEMSKAEVMQRAEDALKRMNFNIEKADTELGYIRTSPLQGAQFFEFWRGDNVGGRNSAEANLHSIRRVVELQISESSKEGGKITIGCDVKTQRLSMPEHEIESSARAYEMFSRSKRSMQKLSLAPEQRRKMFWVDLGSDKKLATKILKRIEKQVTRK